MTIFPCKSKTLNPALETWPNRGYVMVNGEIRMTGSGQELLLTQKCREAYLVGTKLGIFLILE